MFEALAEKFDSLLRKLQGQGRITERNIEDALRDVRLALLEADVNLQVVRDFVEAVKRDALGQEVLRSLTPEQHFLRLVHRELVRLLGEGPGGLDLGGVAPCVILLVGLNGSGKTTTVAKLARHLRAERSRTPYLVPADMYRPAAPGIVLTKMEGDARGGAALSLRTVSGKPILFAGTGEKLDALEPFHADRIASRILGMGDVLSLIERAERAYDREQAQALEKKLRKSEFDLEDFRDQLRAVKKMGSVAELLGMIPGVKKLLRGADLSGAEGELKRVEAIIDSMTRAERRNIRILNASRRKRIAEGSGTSVSEVNRLVKQFTQTKKLLKKIGSGAMPPGMQGLA